MSRSLRLRSLVATIVLVLSGLALSTAVSADNIGNEGCTPGYWKNHTGNWEEYSATQTVGELFPLPASLSSLGSLTLEQALAGGGGPGTLGGAKILLRASVAAFLNAAHEGLGYPYRRYDEPGNIGPRITAALASGDRAAMLSLAAELDAANNLGCPLGKETSTPPPTSTPTPTTTPTF